METSGKKVHLAEGFAAARAFTSMSSPVHSVSSMRPTSFLRLTGLAKVEFHFGELFPRVGFIVTNLETDSRAVVRFYNKRGTAGAVDQGRQASGEDDAAELPSVPVQRGAAVAEP